MAEVEAPPEIPPFHLDGSTIFRLMDDTSFLFPAGDWSDMRPHLAVLYTLARCATMQELGFTPQRGAIGMEIGVRQGVSTLALLAGLRDSGQPGGMLYSLDIDPIETAVAQALVTAAGLDSYWQLHLADSNTWGGCPPILDFLWIDGDHNHPQPTLDFERYAPHVRPGGVIAMHDYFMPTWRTGEDGTLRCVEACIRGNPQYEVCTLPWSFGLTLVRKLG